MFELHKLVEPGGKADRDSVRKELYDPPVAPNVIEAIDSIGRRLRLLARAGTWQIAAPDPELETEMIKKIISKVRFTQDRYLRIRLREAKYLSLIHI